MLKKLIWAILSWIAPYERATPEGERKQLYRAGLALHIDTAANNGALR